VQTGTRPLKNNNMAEGMPEIIALHLPDEKISRKKRENFE
jgi:hypothetical protein